jgi:hypothetical protein
MLLGQDAIGRAELLARSALKSRVCASTVDEESFALNTVDPPPMQPVRAVVAAADAARKTFLLVTECISNILLL